VSVRLGSSAARIGAACLATLVLAFSGVIAGCGGSDEDAAVSGVTGIVTRVDRGASGVRAFTLESDGRSLEILIAPDVDYGFDLAHLDVHAATRDPVYCTLERRDGELYALSIDDA
jgi:hypothetical protein